MTAEPPSGPEVMLRESARLADDLRELAEPFDRQVRAALTPAEWTAVRKVYLTGDGDSYHASCAAEMAFEAIAGVTCEPLSAQRFLDYGAAWMRDPPPDRTLVVATSASGGTRRVVQAIERAREHGALTIALIGTLDSAVALAADRAVVVEVPRRERSPGIAEVVDATGRAIEGRSREVADLVAGARAMMTVGSGPSYGTALFGAAKLVEAAGVLAVGQDLEEWWHLERFALPADMPLFVIAPPGRSHWRAGDLAATARGLGRRVIAVTHSDDTDVTRHANAVLPVHGEVREELSPLVYHLFAGHVAAHVARLLGRVPFQAGRPFLTPPGTP